jgi:hypothetical protein
MDWRKFVLAVKMENEDKPYKDILKIASKKWKEEKKEQKKKQKEELKSKRIKINVKPDGSHYLVRFN